MSNSTHSSDQILKLLFTTQSLAARPVEWYAALHTGDPGADGSANEVSSATDSNYSRSPVSWNLSEASGASKVSNGAEVVFPASAGSGSYSVQFLTIWSSASGGVCMARLPLDPVRSVAPSGAARFPIGEIIIEAPLYV